MSDKKNGKIQRRAPATTPESRENQLVALAVDLAEKQLEDGTATSQVITHYLKIGSTRERLEKEILQENKKLLMAKTESITSAKRVEEMYKQALSAMRTYSGTDDEESDEYD